MLCIMYIKSNYLLFDVDLDLESDWEELYPQILPFTTCADIFSYENTIHVYLPETWKNTIIKMCVVVTAKMLVHSMAW